RHTRFSRDWSSDVCSSDLQVAPPWRQGIRLVAHACYHAAGEGFAVDVGQGVTGRVGPAVGTRRPGEKGRRRAANWVARRRWAAKEGRVQPGRGRRPDRLWRRGNGSRWGVARRTGALAGQEPNQWSATAAKSLSIEHQAVHTRIGRGWPGSAKSGAFPRKRCRRPRVCRSAANPHGGGGAEHRWGARRALSRAGRASGQRGDEVVRLMEEEGALGTGPRGEALPLGFALGPEDRGRADAGGAGGDHVADAVADVERGGGIGAEPRQGEEDALGVGLGSGNVVVEDDDVEGAEMGAGGGDLPGTAALAGDDADGRPALAERREQLGDAGIDPLEELVVQRLVVAVERGEAGGDGILAGDRLDQPDLGARLVGEDLFVAERAADVRRQRASVALEIQPPRGDERAIQVEEDGGHRSRAVCGAVGSFRRLAAAGAKAAGVRHACGSPLTKARTLAEATARVMGCRSPRWVWSRQGENRDRRWSEEGGRLRPRGSRKTVGPADPGGDTGWRARFGAARDAGRRGRAPRADGQTSVLPCGSGRQRTAVAERCDARVDRQAACQPVLPSGAPCLLRA